jgi:predicted acetyltransferase
MNIALIQDSQVSQLLDMQLRQLLSCCFSDQAIFSRQRYFKEMPQQRYLIQDGQDGVIAHAALHDKQVIIDGVTLKIAGIAEVCVTPAHRGKGYVKQILSRIQHDIVASNYHFSVLFGETDVYASSGYISVNNLYLLDDKTTNDPYEQSRTMASNSHWITIPAMVKNACSEWPTGQVRLIGGTF